jgi:hypothetical protein
MNMRAFFLSKLLFMVVVQLNGQSISTKIVDPEGKPVAYASIVIKSILVGTTSNQRGDFNLPIVGNSDDTVIISCLGYETMITTIAQLVRVPKVVLKHSVHTLQDVIVKSVDLDKVIQAVFRNFIENFASNQESNIYLRCSQEIGDGYIGFAEAVGKCYTKSLLIEDRPFIKTESWQVYSHVRKWGFDRAEYVLKTPQVSPVLFTTYHLRHMLPYDAGKYKKTVVDQYLYNGETVFVIQMEPLPEFEKYLRRLDRIYPYFISYFNVIKRYYVTEKTKRLLGINIISNKREEKRRDEHRVYLNREEVVRFTYLEGRAYISYAEKHSTLQNKDGKGSLPINEKIEVFFDQFQQKKLSKSELEKYYWVQGLQGTEEGFYGGYQTQYFTTQPYFVGEGELNDHSFWSKQVLPSFDYGDMIKRIIK